MWALQRAATGKVTVLPDRGTDLFTVQNVAHIKVRITRLVVRHGHLILDAIVAGHGQLLLLPVRGQVPLQAGRVSTGVKVNIFVQIKEADVAKEGAFLVIWMQDNLFDEVGVGSFVLCRSILGGNIAQPYSGRGLTAVGINRR